MNTRTVSRAFRFLLVAIFLASCNSTILPVTQTPIESTGIADIIAKYRQVIPRQMSENNVPGLSIAVVDDQSILWQESFGHTDWDRQIPVTPSTLFSIQSMSKSFTATAAMIAAQEGLVNLDVPITTYLPDFRVNSIFEDHPEQKMTLRILLSHTAGFAHEAPYGGNYDYPAYSFEKHIASISDTWLKFPVGTRYSYSNLGIDLAGTILQVRSGMPFIEYVQKKVLDPLGMKNSTLDINRVRDTSTRAIGHTGVPLPPPVDFLLIPSGGVWTTAADMARYVQFHINKGALDGSRLLREDLAETMYTPPNLAAHDYAQGIVLTTSHGARQLQHGGGGFGFNSEMRWYPELKLGVVVLSNAHTDNEYVFHLGKEVLDSIINSNAGLYAQRAANAAQTEPAYPPSRENTTLSDAGLQALIESKAIPEDEASQKRNSASLGKYVSTTSGFPGETVEISGLSGKLVASYLGTTATLTEVEPGLFFTPSGDAFDLRGPDLMFMNIHLVKTNTPGLPFKIAFYAICALVFLFTLFFWPVRALMLKIRRKSPSADNSSVCPAPDQWLVWAGRLSALASFISLLCLAFIAFFPNQVYLGWPQPYTDLNWWQFALFYLPFASLLLAIGVVLSMVKWMRKTVDVRFMHWYYLVVGLALLAFNLALIIG